MRRQATSPGSRAARLSVGRKLLVNGVGLGVWVSGALWLVFHYLLRVRSEFGPSPHPLEPWWLKLHGAFAFLALWTFGLLWGVHVLNGWSLQRRRWSGGVLFAGFLVLILSGYLLYYTGSDEARAVVSVAHWGIGLAAPLVYLAHRLAKVATLHAVAPPARHPLHEPDADADTTQTIMRQLEPIDPTADRHAERD